jgi:hypothetical protein
MWWEVLLQPSVLGLVRSGFVVLCLGLVHCLLAVLLVGRLLLGFLQGFLHILLISEIGGLPPPPPPTTLNPLHAQGRG